MINYNITYGLSDIYVSKDNEIPIPLPGGVSIELSIPTDNYESCRLVGYDEEIIFNSNEKAEGRLILIGLSNEIKEYIFGIERDKKGGIIGGVSNSPLLHLMFQQKVADGSIIFTTIYNVKFKPTTLSSQTVDSDININEIELKFDCYYSNEYESYYYTLNSNTPLDASEFRYPKYY